MQIKFFLFSKFAIVLYKYVPHTILHFKNFLLHILLLKLLFAIKSHNNNDIDDQL
jgi:hypothetical protein